jgi:hypothetical protein
LKHYNPVDKIWWVTGDTRDSLTMTEWVGHRTFDALRKCTRKPLRKTLFSYFLYSQFEGAKLVLVDCNDLLKMGVITTDFQGCSAHFKTRKKPIPRSG